MSAQRPWQRLSRVMLDLFYPPRCVVCRRDGPWLCDSCQAQVHFVHPGHQGAHQASWAALDGAVSVAYSESVLREAVHQFKYNGVRTLAELFGQMMYACWLAYGVPGEVLVPVPLHARRLRERGYNQSQLLARQLGRYAGLPMDDRTLARHRYTRPQVALTAAERRQNVEGAFGCLSDGLAGRAVVLIDDVLTTGATLEACAAALKAHGADSVWAMTLARASGGHQA